MNNQEIKNLVSALCFESQDGQIYLKKFGNHDNYALTVDFANEKISYGAKSSLMMKRPAISRTRKTSLFWNVLLDCLKKVTHPNISN